MRGCELIPVSRALAHTHTLHGFVCGAGINGIRVPGDNAVSRYYFVLCCSRWNLPLSAGNA